MLSFDMSAHMFPEGLYYEHAEVNRHLTLSSMQKPCCFSLVAWGGVGGLKVSLTRSTPLTYNIGYRQVSTTADTSYDPF